MDTAKEIRKGEALNWEALEPYLRTAIPELSGNMSVAQFHGGHANLTYLLSFGDTELVLRRPPFGKIAPGAHDMKREYRVLSKLYKHYSRAPRAYHLCEDESIIGAKFVVIERCRGVILRTEMLDCFKFFNNAGERVIDAMIKAQAALHLVDYKAAGLEKLGRPEGFLERQIRGWSKRWEFAKTKEVDAMTQVQKILQAEIPQSSIISIVHNDIKPDNCQFQPNNPDEVTSIFDWDMCTLGDPLTDFASTLSYYPDEEFEKFLIEKTGSKGAVRLIGDFPPQQFLIDKYQEYTGFSLDQLSWYRAFAFWKGAVILQQLYKRYADGDTKDPRMAGFGQTMEVMAKYTLNILEK